MLPGFIQKAFPGRPFDIVVCQSDGHSDHKLMLGTRSGALGMSVVISSMPRDERNLLGSQVTS